MHTHRGCTDTTRKSALEVDSGRKISCRTGDSNPRQYCAWLFSQTLYQVSCPCAYLAWSGDVVKLQLFGVSNSHTPYLCVWHCLSYLCIWHCLILVHMSHTCAYGTVYHTCAYVTVSHICAYGTVSHTCAYGTVSHTCAYGTVSHTCAYGILSHTDTTVLADWALKN